MASEELERLVRKLNYHESIIIKLLSSASSNFKDSKIVIVKEKIEQLEELVLDIPDCCGDLFDQWMDTVVQLWDQYSTAAAAAGHRHPTPSITSLYPQPNVTSAQSGSSTTTTTPTPTSSESGSSARGAGASSDLNAAHVTATNSKPHRVALAPRPGALNQSSNGGSSLNGGSNHHLSKHKSSSKYSTRNSGDEHFNSRH